MKRVLLIGCSTAAQTLQNTRFGVPSKAKISIRNIRREGNDDLKKLVKEKKISEDENKGFEKNIQKLTDDHISNIDKILLEKEKEILQV